jgi:hypothetical protein
MVSHSMKCDVTVAVQVLPLFYVSQDRPLHIHSCSARLNLALHAAMTPRYVNFSKTDFSVTEFRAEKYFLIYFFTFLKVWRVSRRVISEELQRASWKTWAASSPLTLVLNHLNKLRHMSEHPKLSVFPVSMFFVFFHSTPSGVGFFFFFVLNRNLICDFCYRHVLLCFKVE